MKTYDILVIGGGPGGYVAAIKASQLGASVALVEKEVVGGICLNHGCIPTKTMLKSAKVFKEIKHADDFGINVAGTVSFEWNKIVERKNSVVKQLTNGVTFLLKKNKVDVFKGTAVPLSANQIQVGDQILSTKKLIIATGATAIVPPIPGVKEAYEKGIVVTSRELLNITKAPKNIVIVGGGVIGVEFATVFSSLGSNVTIIEKLPHILPTIDEEIRTTYTNLLTKQGIKIIVDGGVKEVKNHVVTYTLNDKDEKVEADLILMSVGTRPHTAGLEKLGLTMDRASIVTNEYLQTSVKDVYAIGDVNGKMMLAHTASHEGIIAVEHALGKETHAMDYTRIPQCIYGSPEIASIGMTEKEAKEANKDYIVSKFPIAGNGKALADGEKDGFIKVIFDKKYKEVLGAHIFSYNATELIHELNLVITLEGTAYEIAQTVHPHPTLGEIIHEAALGGIDKPIHI